MPVSASLGAAGLPSVTAGGVLDYILLFFGIVIFAAIVLGLVIAIVLLKRYGIKIVLWRTIRGQTIPVGKMCGTQRRLGLAGDYWTVVKGPGVGRILKVIKVLPKIKFWAGKNEAWFFEREDGEWYNLPPPNLDKEMKNLKFKFSDEDMRLMRVAIARNLKKEFEQEKWWDKYGSVVTRVLEMMLLLVMIIFVMKKMEDLSVELGKVAATLASVVKTQCSGTVAAAPLAFIFPKKFFKKRRLRR